MSELQRRLQERKKLEQEERERRKKEQEDRKIKHAETRRRGPVEAPKIVRPSSSLPDDFLKEQKAQTKLLEQLVTLLQNQPSSVVPQVNEVSDPLEIKDLISKYIKGDLTLDSLPAKRTHRTYRDDEFVERLRHGWKIQVSKADARFTRKSMEQNNELISIGYLRFVLPEFAFEYEQKTSPKDLEMITWFQDHPTFTNTEFRTDLYHSAPRGAASSKIHALLRKGWLIRIKRAHYQVTPSLPNFPKRN